MTAIRGSARAELTELRTVSVLRGGPPPQEEPGEKRSERQEAGEGTGNRAAPAIVAAGGSGRGHGGRGALGPVDDARCNDVVGAGGSGSEDAGRGDRGTAGLLD